MSTPSPLRSQYADDPEMRELVELFISELPERMESLRAAWTDGRLDALQRMAHQLRGSSGGYGFPSIGEAASRVEDALRNFNDSRIQSLQRDLDALASLCDRASGR